MNELEKRLLASPRLPTLPAVAQRILELLRDEDVELKRIASAISCDAALTAKVLRLINSPLYGMSREIVSLREAVLYLGVNAVHSVALSFTFISWLRSGRSDETLDALWRSSLLNGLAARRLATEVGGWDAEEAFLAGLVADMRMAALLLDAWNFPDHFKIVLALHHEPGELPPGSREELRGRILNAAWLCARALSVPGFATETASLAQHVSTLLGIPTSVAQAIVAELPDELRETARFFQIPAAEQKSFDELLSQANERLSELALAADRERSRAGRGSEAEAAGFLELRSELGDSLAVEGRTQLLTRDSLQTLLDAFHRRARRSGTPIGLVLIEIEELKGLEAELGAPAIEELLAELARRLTDRLRRGDQLARLGHGQIAALAAGCGLDTLLHTAERLLVAIEGAPVEVAGRPVRCRASIGVAASRPDRDGLDPRALLSLAGSSLDQARASGESISCCQ
jgi:diguanylate cyclase (GGDEF)-like protein